MEPKILHVEDDPDIRQIALIALETLGGLEVVQCESGEEAVLRASSVAPDLLLLDVMMPGINGEQTLSALRRQPACAAIPAVFMSAKALPSEVARLHAIGAFDVITKPFDPMILADQVRQIWARSRRAIA